jgi:hypothetical protein
MDSLAKASGNTMAGGAQSDFQADFLLYAERTTSLPASYKPFSSPYGVDAF